MRRVCLLLLALAIGGNALDETDKLVGAEHAEIGEFPYQVSLRLSGKKHFCGGSLITRRHVLTAAHCVMAVRKLFLAKVTATVGSNSLTSGGQTYEVAKMSSHPDYKDKKTPDWMYDIGVMTLSTEVKLSDLVGLVKLPTQDIKIGSKAVVSGWGTMVNPYTPLSQRLQKLSLDIIDLATCQSKMPSYARVHDTHICTFVKKGKGACSGDSGGPLAQNGVIIGVVSGGIPCAVGYPDVFTNVYKYLSYVKGVTGQ